MDWIRIVGMGLVVSLGSVVAGDGPLQPPFQVVGIEQSLAEFEATIQLAVPSLRVDLGAVKDRPFPEETQRVTLIGTKGTCGAGLKSVFKRCEFLCGDENEECHYEAEMVSMCAPGSLGIVVAAIPGEHAVTNFRALVEAPAPEAFRLPDTWTEAGPSRPVWPDGADRGYSYELKRSESGDNALSLDMRWSANDPVQSFDSGECSTRSIDGLVEVSCSMVSVIALDDGTPLLVSLADYNLPSAQLVAAFEVGGTSYHLVRLGLKGQTVFGLLVRMDAGWRFLVRPKDYALMC